MTTIEIFFLSLFTTGFLFFVREELKEIFIIIFRFIVTVIYCDILFRKKSRTYISWLIARNITKTIQNSFNIESSQVECPVKMSKFMQKLLGEVFYRHIEIRTKQISADIPRVMSKNDDLIITSTENSLFIKSKEKTKTDKDSV